jgi:transposase-like protein
MTTPSPCTWRHVEPAGIPGGVRWSRRHALRYRDAEALLLERGLSLSYYRIPRRPVRCAEEQWHMDRTQATGMAFAGSRVDAS